jgi:hypothetical protein
VRSLLQPLVFRNEGTQLLQTSVYVLPNLVYEVGHVSSFMVE